MATKLPGKPENFTREQAAAIREVLRSLRSRFDNQTLLAEAIGVTQQNVSRLSSEAGGAGLTYTTATAIVRLAGKDGVDALFAELGLDGRSHGTDLYPPTLKLAVSIARRLNIPERVILAVIDQAGGPQTKLRPALWVDRMIMRHEAERDTLDGIPTPTPSSTVPREKPLRRQA